MSKFVLTAQLRLQAPTNVRQVVDQIQKQLNSVSVNVDVQGAPQAAKQLKKIEEETKAATSAASQLGKTFGVSLKRFAAFSIATRAVGLFTSRLSEAIDESIEFQRELIKISQVTGKTIAQLKGVTDEIDRLSTTLGTSSKSLLSVTRILAQAGIKSNDLKVALEALAKTTLAPTFDDITQTAEGAIAVISQFGEGVGALERQLGAINAVAGQFAVESGDLISAVRRTGGVFKSAGGSLEELLALFTSVRATTRESSESIATGLRTIFTRIQRPATIEYLKQFGVELTDLDGKFVGPYEAVRQLSEALAGLEEGDITFVQIAEQLGGFRQIGKVIPLLQQFSTAEAARQAAIEGGNSLTKDAATAQQALAVQITKVKEEFLAFIRSISNTSTFQLFVKTSLDLASALIDIGEAIKPLIPLLGAFAAIKVTRGIGGFLKGVGSTLGKSDGGKIHAFATGGLVPGTGNRDTVPAMLSPGEFVIRKSSVNKIGADKLAAMNNGYADGGVVQYFNTAGEVDEVSNFFNKKSSVTNQEIVDRFGVAANTAGSVRKAFERGGAADAVKKLLAAQGNKAKKSAAKLASTNKIATIKNDIIGGLFLEQDDDVTGSAEINKLKVPNNKTYNNIFGGNPDQLKGYVYSGLLQDKASPSFKQTVIESVEDAVKQAAINTMQQLEIKPLDINESRAASQALKKIDMNSIQGHIFEAYISALSGFNLSDSGATFDYYDILKNPTARERLNNVFNPDLPSTLKAIDAKRTLSRGSVNNDSNSIANKILADVADGPKSQKRALAKSDFNLTGFATGGPAGSDTVPAMLTPGEYVINRNAAQSIGYSNLNRMNKHGVAGFAKGGPVQYFQSGTTGSGVKSGGNDGDGVFGKFFAFETALALTTGQLGAFTKTAEGADTGLSRTIESLGNMVNVVGTTILTLQSFGVSLSGVKLKELFSTGAGGLGDKITKSLTKSSFFAGYTQSFRASSGELKASGIPFDPSKIGIGLGGKIGKFAGSNIDKKGIKGSLARSISDIGPTLASVTSLAGPLAAVAGVAAGIGALSSVIADGLGYQKSYNDAIQEGNVAKAKELAVLQNVPGIVQLFGSSVSEAYTSVLSSFGGPTTESLKLAAESAALAGKAQKEMASNAKLAADRLKEVADGSLSIIDAFSSGDLTKDIKNNLNTFKSVSKQASNSISELDDLYNNQKTGAGTIARSFAENPVLGVGVAVADLGAQAAGTTLGGVINEMGSLVGLRKSYNQRVEELNKKEAKAREDLVKSLEQKKPEFVRLAKILAISKNSGATLDDFLSSLDKETRETFERLGTAEISKIIEDQNKAVQDNKKFLEALNLGLRDFTAGASASAIELTNALERTQTGSNSFDQTLRTLEASLSSTAVALNPQEVARAQQEVAQAMRNFGVAPEQVQTTQNKLQAFNLVQLNAEEALRNVAKRPGQDTTPKPVLNAFGEELAEILQKQGVDQGSIQTIKDLLLGANLSEEDAARITNEQNIGPILEKILGPLGKQLFQQLEPGAKALQAVNKILIDATKKRIALEQEAVKARQNSIAIELEAAKNIEEFGGRVLTFADKVNFANRSVNESLRNAGLSQGVGGGSTREIAAVQNELIARQRTLQGRQDTAVSTGQNAFAEVSGVEDDKRPQLEAAQQELITFARERIKLVKEEIEIARKKNALEKSSLDNLLSGDIISFFEEQAAVGASAVLRGGGDTSAFSASTLGRAFTNLQGQNLPPEQLQGIASGTLRAFGITDTESARVLSDNTIEQQASRREGRELSSILAQGGRNLAEMAEMRVNAQNVYIDYAGSRANVSNGPAAPVAPIAPAANNAANPNQPQAPAAAAASAPMSEETVARMGNVFKQFSDTVNRLENTNLSVKLDTVNVNVNFNNTGFLASLTDTIRTSVLDEVKNAVTKLEVGQNGDIKFKSRVL